VALYVFQVISLRGRYLRVGFLNSFQRMAVPSWRRGVI
jgi:hypothetical protein